MSSIPAVLPFLTDDEIRQIAHPLTQPAAIVRWFRHNGFDGLKVRPNGMPLIARAHFDAMTASVAMQNAATTEQAPDATAFLARIGRKAKSRAPAP
jgi:hypothetical protein